MTYVFEEDLFVFLSGAGTSAGSRVYPLNLPQGGTLPAIRYFLVSDPSMVTHSGRSKTRNPRYQMDCYGATYLDAKRLAMQVITLLDGYSGTMGSAQCQAGFQENQVDNFDPETGRYWVSVDVVMWFAEP